MKLFFELKMATQEIQTDVNIFFTIPKEKLSSILSSKNGESPTRLTDINQKDRASINEIMVKIEMKKLNSIIANKDPLKNSLLLVDNHRVYPLCKNPAVSKRPVTLWDKKTTRLENKDSYDESLGVLSKPLFVKPTTPIVFSIAKRNTPSSVAM